MGAEQVAASALFDEEWYAEQVGVAFPTRLSAAEDYVRRARTQQVSPHPLFEPDWINPGGRWRESATDPLSHYLSRADRASLSTHPLLPERAEEVVAALTPDALLPKTTGPRLVWGPAREAAFAWLVGTPVTSGRGGAVDVSVVVPTTRGFRRTCFWLRRLFRTHSRDDPSIELVVVPETPADERLAVLVALSLPGTRVRVGTESDRGPVTVRIDDPDLEPPEWPWLHQLVARLDDAAVGRVGPLLVEQDQTVVAAARLPADDGPVPFLGGETPADAARMAHLPVPDLWPGVVAFRTAEGPRDPAYVVPGARVVAPPPDG